MSSIVKMMRRQLAGVVALALIAATFVVVRLPTSSAAELEELASSYGFEPKSIALPSGLPQQTIRRVNQDYRHIDAWISSVGASVAMNDLDGDGLANDLCLTDPRVDEVIVTPVPDERSDRYEPFVLDPGDLPMNDVMAPMGCVPGDFNEDGRLDLLVYLWGRTPILYLADPDATVLGPEAYRATEMVPGRQGEVYDGPQWNTNTVAVDDFDGDGHLDVFVGNYFPHGPVLDDSISGGVQMNHSMSQAFNGGEDYFLRWTGVTGGDEPEVTFELLEDVLPDDVSKGWALAAGANDVDGDLLPELYVGNDFGPDRLLYNRSTPGDIRFAVVEGARKPMVPKSKHVGLDSFKGMGIDFGDLDGDGMYDMFVSNITTSFGIEESHFAFVSDADDPAELRARLQSGEAPWTDESAPLGLAWSGWGWDAKIADFDNSGDLVVAQATGFVKGRTNRWPQLQELATANDQLLSNPMAWPRITEGDDLAGDQHMAFFVKNDDGRYVDLSHELGLAIPVPTRGIATGDSDGDGLLDFAIARQWDEPLFYQNTSPSEDAFLGLRLTHDAEPSPGDLAAPGSPVVGAQIAVTREDGRRFITRVDGGSGHSGKRSHEAHIGLGSGVTGPLDVNLKWRDRTGQVREENLRLEPGWHSLQLGTTTQER
ncbi:CRTAC1 family protein [Actinoalloteichus sp. GBA129-24]|uniref:CRTAC1 family protein n=1 Tax=Actinoalloteichus sp. GBA129-24 TaxID=1612551 RepID=UPI0009508731|nr:CRTAC1 family protein [Actinoalloteichus sp. GBA129-24]APU21809.1 hypothetical protein UA75_19095 [Actinoalloteichus sp. GBA129-24]